MLFFSWLFLLKVNIDCVWLEFELFLCQTFGGDAVVGVYADVAGALQVGRVRSTLMLLASALVLSGNVWAVGFCPQE
jgi:hypothetical protein